MIEKMMDPNIIDYYIINCAIPSIITIENRYQIDFGKPSTEPGHNSTLKVVLASYCLHTFLIFCFRSSFISELGSKEASASPEIEHRM